MTLLGDFEGVGRKGDDVVAAADPERAFECLFEGRHDDVFSIPLVGYMTFAPRSVRSWRSTERWQRDSSAQ
jgi:hypothetical protein